MPSSSRILMKTALFASAAWLGGCFLGADDGPGSAEKQQSQEAAGKGSGDLTNAMSSMQSSQYSYGKEDLTDLRNAQANYAEAVRLNPGNGAAQLGLALTNVLLAAQDPRLADVLNRTVDGKSPFDSRVVDAAPLMRSGVLAKVAEASTWPEFHEIQDSIEKVLLPALEDAISRIKVAYDDPGFSMTLTLDGSVRELDHVEAGILLAGVHAIHALTTLWLARDIDIDYQGSYQWIEDLKGLDSAENFSDLTAAQRDALRKATELFAQDAPFLAVRPAWKERLAGVDDEISQALDILKEGMASLSRETDAQDDDLIHKCGLFEEGGCIDPDGYQSGLDAIDSGRKYMKQPYQLELEDLDTAITVDFSAYFRVQDYKKLLPYYGFYDPDEWSDEKPALYFTDASGRITGDFMTLKHITDAADSEGTPAAQVVDQIRAVIHFQDPTFQGFLPGATEGDIWNLIRKQAELDDGGSDVIDPLDSTYTIPLALRKRSLETLRPDFALGLLGK